MQNPAIADRKCVSTWSRMIITVVSVGIFTGVWFLYYGACVFHSHILLGNIATVVIYTVIYDCFCRLYKAYKINAYPIGETVFSQTLSFGMADMILYVECCLIHNGYINILPGLMAALIQIVMTAIWAIGFKQYYIKRVAPRETLLIHGTMDEREFIRQLIGKYSHIFAIKESVSSAVSAAQLADKIDRYDTVILYEVPFGKRTDLISYCLNAGKTFYMTPRVSDLIIGSFENRHMIDTPLLKYEYESERIGKWLPKRILDIVLSILGLTITVPFALITMLAIKLEDGGDIFFKQERYTRNWKVFNIIKFRSMVMNAEKDGKPLPCVEGDTRITKVGKFIRRFRIDEIPQLWNVLKGDMSIVGPRPERTEHVEAYVRELPEFAYRLRVKGGLTGYAQIYGKYNTSPYDKLKLDLMYIENQSFLMDVKIILLTIKTIFIPESTEGFTEEKSKKMRDGTAEKSSKEILLAAEGRR